MTKITLFQCPAPVWDSKGVPTVTYQGKDMSPKEYAERLAEAIRERIDFPTDLIVLPEYVPGVSHRDYLKPLEDVAREKGLQILAAHTEATPEGIYARVACLGKQSSWHQDKLFPIHSERVSGIVSGKDIHMLAFSGGQKIAVLICQDIPALYDPHVKEVMADEEYHGTTEFGKRLKEQVSHADIIIVPSYSTQDPLQPERFANLWKSLLLDTHKQTGKTIVYVNSSNNGGDSCVIARGNIIENLGKGISLRTFDL